MMSFFEPGQTRRFAAPADQRGQSPGQLLVSQVIAEYFEVQRRRGIAGRTLDEYRNALWYVIEFLGCDTPIRDIPANFPIQFLTWLRDTPMAPRKPRSLPEDFSAASVSMFLRQPPPRSQTTRPRSEQTIGRYWRHTHAFFASMRLDTKLTLDDRPNLSLPPALVPARSEVRGWWEETLDAAQGTATASQRRRVVFLQSLLLVTGMRLGEALKALQEDVEGHWLLLRPGMVKTRRPRILYLSGRALGVAAALRNGWRTPSLFPLDADTRLAGWAKSTSRWQRLARSCRPDSSGTPAEPEKRHQSMRRVLASFLHRKDSVAESAQLGHGKGVVFEYYLDILRHLPRLLEPFALPAIEGFVWPEPIEADRKIPRRLYAEWRHLVGQRRRKRI